MRQLSTAYQMKYTERLKDDQRCLIEQQMADLLRFEKVGVIIFYWFSRHNSSLSQSSCRNDDEKLNAKGTSSRERRYS